MKRFVLSLVPLAIVAGANYVYRNHFEGLDGSRGLVWHTYDARMLASRIAIQAGSRPDPAGLGRTLEEFAAATADNPQQVRAARAMAGAAARGDFAEVGRLAALADAEEARLMDGRKRRNVEVAVELRWWGDLALVLGLLLGVLIGLLGWLSRATSPPTQGGR